VLTIRGMAADDLVVCPGDTVEWILTGTENSFTVDFGAQSPVGSETAFQSKEGRVGITISGSAERGTAYFYTLDADPWRTAEGRIIIDDADPLESDAPLDSE